MLSFETALEFVTNAIHDKWVEWNGATPTSIPTELTREFPWGWIFESPLEGDSQPENRYPGIVLSVDRFTGKTQIINGGPILNDDWGMMGLFLVEIGDDQKAVYSLYQELTNRSSSETVDELSMVPATLAIGDLLSLRSINQAFQRRGAETVLQRYDA